MLVEQLELPVKIVRGDYSNIKITTNDDLAVAEHLLTMGAVRHDEKG